MGWVMQYLAKITGYSPAQAKRLIKQYRETGRIVRKQRTIKGFTQTYTVQDKLTTLNTSSHNQTINTSDF